MTERIQPQCKGATAAGRECHLRVPMMFLLLRDGTARSARMVYLAICQTPTIKAVRSSSQMSKLTSSEGLMAQEILFSQRRTLHKRRESAPVAITPQVMHPSPFLFALAAAASAYAACSSGTATVSGNFKLSAYNPATETSSTLNLLNVYTQPGASYNILSTSSGPSAGVNEYSLTNGVLTGIPSSQYLSPINYIGLETPPSDESIYPTAGPWLLFSNIYTPPAVFCSVPDPTSGLDILSLNGFTNLFSVCESSFYAPFPNVYALIFNASSTAQRDEPDTYDGSSCIPIDVANGRERMNACTLRHAKKSGYSYAPRIFGDATQAPTEDQIEPTLDPWLLFSNEPEGALPAPFCSAPGSITGFDIFTRNGFTNLLSICSTALRDVETSPLMFNLSSTSRIIEIAIRLTCDARRRAAATLCATSIIDTRTHPPSQLWNTTIFRSWFSLLGYSESQVIDFLCDAIADVVATMSAGLPNTDSPLNKRRRIEEEEIDVNIKKHDSLWFEDGNVVLQAENTLFRVHQSMLSRNSEVFDGMFSVPRPDDTEQLEGIPVVKLYDDPYELADFLDVLYNGVKFQSHSHKPHYVVIQSLLRLSSKYCVDYLRSEALFQLERMFPADISTFDSYAKGENPISFELADRVSAANLTREMNLTVLHYRALYHCAIMPTKYLISGILHSRGTLVKLSDEDLILCLGRGRMRLTLATCQMMDQAFHIPLPNCPRPRECQDCLRRIYDANRAHPSVVTYVALENSDNWIEKAFTGNPQTKVCANCIRAVKDKATELRGEILKNLGTCFT
ncbi:hypothetical protein NM688_g714 [Phlebia brevispora]|uniref:Uncharacterized protein n=1 Tax=Phlebia brevispora TaxID=194682 RepID=A0ACC1TDJ9_9APHY|nr:hypothetical protein NM688_g714 [Phlebia brevispora]